MKNIPSNIIFIFLLLSFGIEGCLFPQRESTPTEERKPVQHKQKGAHVFGLRSHKNLEFLSRNNIEWVTLVPWGFQENCKSPIMKHRHGDSIRAEKSNTELLERIQRLKLAGFKVFLKPHIWIDNPADGEWRSDIYPAKEEDWETWKESYRDFILRYALLAEKAEAEMFCVGTELSRLSLEKPQFWKELIREVRSIYSGEITYAANWYQEYDQISFWGELDYIGIQAYFPLVENENPTTQEITKGWNQYFPTIESLNKQYNRPILFTEMGYKSTSGSAIRPWEWMDHSNHSEEIYSAETQANCYQAFFNTIWQKDWFAGVHLWQMRADHKERVQEKNNLDFTPLGKPAESVIKKGFE